MSRLRRYLTAPRRFNRSRGFGIHSPFAFDFVTSTLRERYRYYAYADLADVRSHARRLIAESGRRADRRLISEKGMRRLFRIVCRFNPSEMLEIGSDYGPATAAMLLPRSDSRLVCAPDLESAERVRRDATATFDSRIAVAHSTAEAFADYAERLSALPDPTAFILVNAVSPDDAAEAADATLRLPAALKIIIVRNMDGRRSEGRRLFVERLTSSVDYGMTFFNHKTAITVLDRRLPRQGFSLWF